MFNKVSKTFQYGQHTVTLETGEIARQAQRRSDGIDGRYRCAGNGCRQG